MTRSAAWRQITPFFIYCIVSFSMADFIFGLDTSLFGGLQALPGFLNVFGVPRPGKTPYLPTLRKSIMNSVVFLGRLFGVFCFEPLTERIGYRFLIVFIVGVQLIAVIIEITSKEWIQFTIGRVISYMTIGFIEACVPSYSAEIAPPELRGFFSGMFVPIQTAAGIWGSGMSRAFTHEQGRKGWMVPVGVQFIPIVFTFGMIWFTVESPRWLISKGRREEALQNLKRLRPKEHTDDGLAELEIEAMSQALEYDKSIKEAGWMELFSGSMWRRTVSVALMFFVYEAGGNQFSSAYGTTFFQSVGLASKSFTYNIVITLAGFIGAMVAITTTDKVGRRPLCIIGSVSCVVWNVIVAAMGSKTDLSTADVNAVVASFVLLVFSTKVAFAIHSFIVTTEMGGTRMRKKLMMVGASFDVISSFLVTFCSPYILAKIGAKIGYVFAAISFIGLVYAVLFLPELRGRSLEEVDELFEKPRFRWGWQYEGVKTTGAGAAISQLEHTGHLDVEVEEVRMESDEKNNEKS